MPLKTYALYDLIGVKAAFEDGTAEALLTALWQAAEGWTTYYAPGPLGLEGRQNVVQAPRVVVRSFSDSALLHTREEHTLSAFYRIARSLKSAIERVGAAYCVVNRAQEVAHPAMPPGGMRGFDDDGGSGSGAGGWASGGLGARAGAQGRRASRDAAQRRPSCFRVECRPTAES